MINVFLHGSLKALADAESLPLALDVQTPAEAVLALCLQLPGFEPAMRVGSFRLSLESGSDSPALDEDMLSLKFGRQRELHIFPEVAGAGLEGAALYWVIGLTVVSVAYALSISPEVGGYDRDSADEKASYLFDGAVNTHAQGGIVPLIFGGPIRVGSTVVSAGVTSERVQLYGPHRADYWNGLAWFYGTFGGGGGGGKSGRRPIEGVNTLQTNATIRVVDLIGEGEMRGLVDGLKSVFINGTAVQSADETINIEGVNIEWRSGLPDQAPLTGIPAIESERVVNRRIKKATPIVKAVTNAKVDSARVTLRFPRLVSVNRKGDAFAATVAFRIQVQPSGGSYKTELEEKISDKNTSPAELSFRVPLEGAAPWNIRVTRLTADSESDKLQNELHFARLTEIIEAKQSYPYSALIGLTAEADKFEGQINKREYEMYGLIVDVPNNYDVATRLYTGIWDGTFKKAWTDNPAWCFFKMLTERRFGLGGEIATEYLSATKWELYSIAQFCDQLVPDGKGGTEPRFRFTGVVSKAADAKKLLDNMLSNFKSNLFYGGGSVIPVQGSAADATALVTNANVIGGEFEYSDLAVSKRVSAAAVSFNDPEDSFKLGIELVIDDDLVEKYGYKQKDIVAMFCTSRAQAQRFGKHLLFEQEYESDTLKYSTSLEHASVRPGQVIRQSDAAVSGLRAYGRVRRYVAASRLLTLDQIDLDASLEWTASLVLPDGTVAEAKVSAIDGHTVTLAKALAAAPLPNAICVFSAPEVEPRMWRVLRVSEKDNLEFTFAAAAYHPDKFAAIEAGINVSEPDYVWYPNGDLAPPASTTLFEHLYEDNDLIRVALDVGVTAADDPRISEIQYEIKGPDDDDFQPAGLSAARTIEVKNVRTGAHKARARFIGDTDHSASSWTDSAPLNVLGKKAKPAKPKSLIATAISKGYSLSWAAPAELDYSHSEVLDAGYVVSTVLPAGATLRGSISANIFSRFNAVVGTRLRIWVRHIDTTGNVSSLATAVVTPTEVVGKKGDKGDAGRGVKSTTSVTNATTGVTVVTTTYTDGTTSSITIPPSTLPPTTPGFTK